MDGESAGWVEVGFAFAASKILKPEGMAEMGEGIMLIAVLLLALYGCAELISRMAARILKPKEEFAGIRVIPVSGHRTDMEYIVRSAAAQCKCAGGRALLLDTGMDEETRKIAERACEATGSVGFCEAADLDDILHKRLQ